MLLFEISSKVLVAKRETLKNIIVRAAELTIQTPLAEIKARESAVEQTYRNIVDVQAEIEYLTGPAEFDLQQAEMIHIENLYYHAKSSLLALKDLIEYNNNTVQQRLVYNAMATTTINIIEPRVFASIPEVKLSSSHRNTSDVCAECNKVNHKGEQCPQLFKTSIHNRSISVKRKKTLCRVCTTTRIFE